MFTTNQSTPSGATGGLVANFKNTKKSSVSSNLVTSSSSFYTAEKLLNKNLNTNRINFYSPKNTSTSKEISTPEAGGSSTEREKRKNKTIADFFVLPVKNSKATNSTNEASSSAASSTSFKQQPYKRAKESYATSSPNVTKHPLLVKKGRDLIVLMGKVDSCMQLHKEYPNINAMWDVYGKLLQIKVGKQRYEHILLMRSHTGGPILQSIYYDFNNNNLQQFEKDCYLRAVGRFVGVNRLHTYKLEKIDAKERCRFHTG